MRFIIRLRSAPVGTAVWTCYFANETRTISTGLMANVDQPITLSVAYNTGYIGVNLFDVNRKVVYSAELKTLFFPMEETTYYWDCQSNAIAGEPVVVSPISKEIASPYTAPEQVVIMPISQIPPPSAIGLPDYTTAQEVEAAAEALKQQVKETPKVFDWSILAIAGILIGALMMLVIGKKK